MKPTLALTAILALGASSLLMAGEAETTTTSNYQAPMAPTQHVGWYLGGGADYMFDAEEVFYNGHVGYDFGNGSSVFLESGWLGEEEEPSFLLPFVTADIFTESFGLYVGVGAGAANIDVSVGAFGDDEWSFTAQAFAGLVYNVTPNFEISGGARYIWLDAVSLGGANFDDLDDVGAGLGIRFNF